MSSICDPFSNMLRFRLVDFEKIPPDTIGVYGIWYFKRCIYIGKAEKPADIKSTTAALEYEP